jgi:hypothetical protein
MLLCGQINRQIDVRLPVSLVSTSISIPKLSAVSAWHSVQCGRTPGAGEMLPIPCEVVNVYLLRAPSFDTVSTIVVHKGWVAGLLRALSWWGR